MGTGGEALHFGLSHYVKEVRSHQRWGAVNVVLAIMLQLKSIMLDPACVDLSVCLVVSLCLWGGQAPTKAQLQLTVLEEPRQLHVYQVVFL